MAAEKILLFLHHDRFYDVARGIVEDKYRRHGVAPIDFVVKQNLNNCFCSRGYTTLYGADGQPAVELTLITERNQEVATRLMTALVSNEPVELWEVRKLLNAPPRLSLAGSAEDLDSMSFEERRDKFEKLLLPYLIEGTQQLEAGDSIKTFLSKSAAVSYGETLLSGDSDTHRRFSTVETPPGSPAGESESDLPGERSETSHPETDIMFWTTRSKENELLDLVIEMRVRVCGTEVIYPTSIYRGLESDGLEQGAAAPSIVMRACLAFDPYS
tara:strand:- start:10238 stop:11050 length:813 start_codon:yes stop_codon:yes gene_type:complete